MKKELEEKIQEKIKQLEEAIELHKQNFLLATGGLNLLKQLLEETKEVKKEN